MLKTNVSVNNKIWGNTKKLGRPCRCMPPRGYGPRSGVCRPL